MNPNRLPWPTKVAYGLPAFALAVVGIPVYVYIPKFYSDVVGIDIAVIESQPEDIRGLTALATLGAQLWDEKPLLP